MAFDDLRNMVGWMYEHLRPFLLRSCCVLVVPILLLRCVLLPFVCVLSCVLLRPFLVDIENSTFAVFLRHFLEGTVEDLFLERVYCTFCCCHVFLVSGVGGLLFLFPFCCLLFSGGRLCKFFMGHDRDMRLRK